MGGTIFAAMERNAAQVTDFFRLPVDQVVEIGRQVAIWTIAAAIPERRSLIRIVARSSA